MLKKKRCHVCKYLNSQKNFFCKICTTPLKPNPIIKSTKEELDIYYSCLDEILCKLENEKK